MMMIIGGLLADLLRTKRIMSTTAVRKLFNAVGFLGPAVCLVGTGYIECDAPAAVTLIVIAVGLSGLSMAGWGVNHLDLAPAYAGTLMGITNMVATIPGFLGPSVVGAFTYKNQTRQAWRNVFFVSAGVYVFGTVFYCFFGSGQKQSWAVQIDTAEVDHLNKNESKTVQGNPQREIKFNDK
jgi:ACS family sodium-dependent inorganic phosphate cotransporter-like MFS transporter 5